MTYVQEFSVDSFPFWDGAKDTVAAVRKAGKMDDLQMLVEDNFCSMIPTKTQINDFVWFSKDWILEMLGIEVARDEEL